VARSVYVSYLLQSKLTLLSLAAALIALSSARVMFTRGEKPQKHGVGVMVSIFGLLLLLSASAWYLGNQSTTRMSLWSAASTAHTTGSEVLFGSGPNTFLYKPAAIESEFDKGELVIPWVHNLYLEAYYDQGLFGLLGILALTIIPLIRASRIEDRAVRAMLMASMLTFCLLSLFEITLTRRFYFAYLAIMYGLPIAHTLRKNDE
jgi:O-antigen ligase